MTKMTKRDYFTSLRNIPAVSADPDLTAFIDRELELLAKKNSGSNGKTATQVANDVTKDAIYAGMEANRAYLVSEMIKAIPALYDASTPKASALVNQMVKEGRVTKSQEKGRSYFCKA